MASAGYGPVNQNGVKSSRDDEDGFVDEWGLRYEGHRKPGGGTFTRKSSSRRRYFYIAGVAIVVIILIVIIAVAVQKHTSPSPSEQEKPSFASVRWKNNTEDGVVMYPRPDDGSVLIKYDSRAVGEQGYWPYLQSLEYHLHDYQMLNEHGTEFIACNKTYAPANKVCQFQLSQVKPCDTYNHFGYPEGRPCVMLQLNLPINQTAIPFPKDSAEAKKLGDRYNSDYIGVTCEGVTEEDRRYLDSGTTAYKPVEYYPKEGFPIWWFRPRTIHKFIAPIVMVQFNTVQDATYVQIKCTAWGQNFNNGRPDNSTLYSTTFVINHI